MSFCDCIFFFKPKTAYEMRISGWSSDVCSSDLNGEASGDLLREAAEQGRNLLVYIRNTGTNVRDLMAAIGAQPTTAQYVRTFFQDYIQQVFIGDYQELRTREHPLSKRQQILEAVEEIDTKQVQRSRLLEWYITRICRGDQKKGHAASRKSTRLNSSHSCA